jgi:FtsH-binding integral membrane protein
MYLGSYGNLPMTDDANNPPGQTIIPPGVPVPQRPMTPDEVAKQARALAKKTRALTQLFLRHVYYAMALGLVASGGASYIATHSLFVNKLVFGFPQIFLVFAAPSLLLNYAFSGNKIANMSVGMLRLAFVGYSAVMGLWATCILGWFTPFGSQAQMFFVVALAYATTSFCAYATKTLLDSREALILMMIVGLAPAAVFSLALHLGLWQFLTSAVGLAMFAAITARQTPQLKTSFASALNVVDAHHRFAVAGALILYLGFANIFNSIFSLSFLNYFARRGPRPPR